jgi:riboflavin synthase
MKKLASIAHSRAGDKGNILMLSLIPFDEKDYEFLIKEVTAERVKTHLSHLIKGEVIRYEIPGIKALQFTCYQALGTGVTTSLALDAHGKSLSYALLEMEI